MRKNYLLLILSLLFVNAYQAWGQEIPLGTYVQIKLKGFYSYAERNHSFKLGYTINDEDASTLNPLGSRCYSINTGGNSDKGLEVLFTESLINVPTRSSLPAHIYLKVDGWEESASAERCGDRCNFDDLDLPTVAVPCRDEHRSIDDREWTYWQKIIFSDYAPGQWHPIPYVISTPTKNYEVIGEFRYILPNRVFQNPKFDEKFANYCLNDSEPDRVKLSVDPQNGIPSVNGMKYTWEYQVNGSYIIPNGATCYQRCIRDSTYIGPKCIKWGLPDECISGGEITVGCERICKKYSEGYWQYNYENCNPYPCDKVVNYSSGWTTLQTGNSNFFETNDIFSLPGLIPYLQGVYGQAKKLLKPNITFRVRTEYGYNPVKNPSDVSQTVIINWPPPPEFQGIAPNSDTYSTLPERIEENSYVRLEHAKCKEEIPDNASGKIVIKRITNIYATSGGGYYASLKFPNSRVLNIPNIETDPAGNVVKVNGVNKREAVFPDDAPNAKNVPGLLKGRYEIAFENISRTQTDSIFPTGTTEFGCFIYKIYLNIKEPATTPDITNGVRVFAKNGGIENISCHTSNDGIVEARVENGFGPYTYVLQKQLGASWQEVQRKTVPETITTFSNLPSFEANQEITYRIQVLDNFGCSTLSKGTSQPFTLKRPDPLVINPVVTRRNRVEFRGYDVKCFDDLAEIDVSASGGVVTNGRVGGTQITAPNLNYTFKIYEQGTLTPLKTHTGGVGINTITGLAPGKTYEIEVTDANGCTSNRTTFELTRPPELLLTTSTESIHCFNGSDGSISASASKQGTSNFTFNLKKIAPGTENYTEVTGNNALFENLRAGTYEITATDSTGCFQRDTVEVTQPPLLVATVLTNTRKEVSCIGNTDGEIQVRFTGGTPPYTIEWAYQSQSGWINVISTTTPWNSTAEQLSASSTEEVFLFKNLSPGIYYVRFKDSKNCDNDIVGGVVAQFTITSPSNPLDATIALNKNVSCFGGSDGSITVIPFGGWGSYQYAVDGGPFGSSPVINGLVAGTHSIQVKDLYGCVKTVETIITEPEILNLSLQGTTNPNCYGSADGNITLNITGGIPPYRLSFDNGANWAYIGISSNQYILTGLTAGNYTITLSDANNCLAPATVSTVLSQPAAIGFSGTPVITNTFCGQNNGQITVSIQGGVPAYSYSWEKFETGGYTLISGATSNILSNIYAGSYRVKVTDAQNCTWTSPPVAVIDEGSPEIVNLQTEPVKCFGESNGNLSFDVTGGQAPYQWRIAGGAWQNVTGMVSVSNLRGGANNIHIIEIRGANGCIRPFNIEIPEPALLTVSFDLQKPVCVGGNNGRITATVNGGNGGYTYEWTNYPSVSGPILDLVAQGNYELRITDTKGCMLTTSVTLNNPDSTRVPFDPIINICQGNSYTFDAGNPGASYVWTNSQDQLIGNAQTLQLNKTGEYKVKITTSLGCTSEHSFRLDVRDDLVKADILATSETYAQDTVVFIDISRTLIADPNNPTQIPDRVEWIYDTSNPDIIRAGGIAGYTEELIFMKEGIYTVVLRAHWTTCFDEISKSLVVLPRIAQTDQQDGLGYQGADITELKAYPNPSNGTFQVAVTLNKTSPVSISLYSLQESKSLMNLEDVGGTNYVFDFNMPGQLPAGVYALMVTTANETKFFRVVIQR